MSAIRALRQLTASSVTRFGARSFVTSSALRSLRPMAISSTRAFSISARKFGEGVTDVALTQKLGEELQYEKDASSDVPEPDFLKAFKAQGVWTLGDVSGNDEVTLMRKFGNEDVRVMFSIADIQTEQESEFEEEATEAENEEAPAHSYPIRCSVSITKGNAGGALTVDAMCQDGTFIIDNISFYNDAKVGTELSAEADWTRRGLYIGPQFDTLDVGVQEEFEKFLGERGINDSLALFVPEYAEHKEQKEYVNWLSNVKNFVEA